MWLYVLQLLSMSACCVDFHNCSGTGIYFRELAIYIQTYIRQMRANLARLQLVWLVFAFEGFIRKGSHGKLDHTQSRVS